MTESLAAHRQTWCWRGWWEFYILTCRKQRETGPQSPPWVHTSSNRVTPPDSANPIRVPSTPRWLKYGGLNKNVPHRSVEEVWPCWRKCVTGGRLWGFRNSSQAQCLFFFLLPADLNVKLSATYSATCLPVYYYDSHHEENGLNPWTCKQAPIKCFLIRVAWLWYFFTATEILRH